MRIAAVAKAIQVLSKLGDELYIEGYKDKVSGNWCSSPPLIEKAAPTTAFSTEPHHLDQRASRPAHTTHLRRRTAALVPC